MKCKLICARGAWKEWCAGSIDPCAGSTDVIDSRCSLSVDVIYVYVVYELCFVIYVCVVDVLCFMRCLFEHFEGSKACSTSRGLKHVVLRGVC